MAGVQYTVDGEGFAEATARLRALADGFATAETYDRIGSLVTGQTQQRVATDKAAPDGARWPGWSPAYGATRHAGQSLLQADGHLVDSIQQVIEGDELRVGTNLVYGAIHQFGGAEAGKPGLPARPYLGLSPDDAAAIEGLVEDRLRMLLA